MGSKYVNVGFLVFGFWFLYCHNSRCEIRAALNGPAATVSRFVTQDRCMLDSLDFYSMTCFQLTCNLHMFSDAAFARTQ